MDEEFNKKSSKPLYYIIQPTLDFKSFTMQDVYRTSTGIELEKKKKGEVTNPVGVIDQVAETNSEEGRQESSGQEVINTKQLLETDNKKKDIKTTITRLARYPMMLERPICEAIIKGKSVRFQIESKRGDTIKVRIEDKLETWKISDIEQLEVIS